MSLPEPGTSIKPKVNKEIVIDLVRKLYGFTTLVVEELYGFDDINYFVKQTKPNQTLRYFLVLSNQLLHIIQTLRYFLVLSNQLLHIIVVFDSTQTKRCDIFFKPNQTLRYFLVLSNQLLHIIVVFDSTQSTSAHHPNQTLRYFLVLSNQLLHIIQTKPVHEYFQFNIILVLNNQGYFGLFCSVYFAYIFQLTFNTSNVHLNLYMINFAEHFEVTVGHFEARKLLRNDVSLMFFKRFSNKNYEINFEFPQNVSSSPLLLITFGDETPKTLLRADTFHVARVNEAMQKFHHCYYDHRISIWSLEHLL
ncbi:hypothetical protein L9F63_012900 [Diploptera punctata]|uniref:Uncharacterized protein n=1 Tax=Diploptera punctata TaxID=6984 RepID=A0AAD8ABF9_DIPPU|nr:hypothetical protein L9F63_012900 [Diploptera punctata]